VAALRYWVLGLPAPGTVASRTLDPRGRLAALEQSGWRIRFLDYGRQDGYELPGRVFAQKDGTRVRLVVGRWRLPGMPEA
jgi:outer membrane lipoprotein LolB